MRGSLNVSAGNPGRSFPDPMAVSDCRQTPLFDSQAAGAAGRLK
jgi:hypothetical protein